MLACAECEEGISVSAADCDRQPFLSNFLHGTIDLKTGEVFAHRREDIITKLVHFNYEPTAEYPLFFRFMHTIMGAVPMLPKVTKSAPAEWWNTCKSVSGMP
jgi:putative DNA primase/helicase